MSLSKHWSALLDDYVIDLAWSPGGSLFAAASQSGGVTIYDSKTGEVKHALSGHTDGTNCLTWMPVGRTVPGEPSSHSAQPEASPYLLATGGQDGFVRFWDTTTGLQTAEVKLGNDWVEHIVWVGRTVPGEPSSTAVQPETSPYLVAAAGKKLIALKPDGSVTHTFPVAPKTISALTVFSPAALNSQLSTLSSPPCLSAAYFGGVCTWNAATFVATKEFPYGNTIHALVWSPDGRWLVAGCQDNAVHLWAPAEDNELHMSGYETKLKELSFSHDSKWLATGGGRDACVWDCTVKGPEGREPLSLPHSARVCAVAFQNRHGRLATGSTDGVFTLWDPNRKNPMIAEARLPAAVTKFAWSPDDALLAVGTEKGALFVFKVL